MPRPVAVEVHSECSRFSHRAVGTSSFREIMLNKINNSQVNDILWWTTAFCLIGFVYLRGATDWERFYLPATLDNYATAPLVANPSYILFLFIPLSFLPNQIAGAILALLNVVCLYVSSRITNANKWLLLLNLPSLIVITFGQIDGLVTVGAVIGSVAIQTNNGFLFGGALLLLGLKPQVGGILAIIYLTWMIAKKQYLETMQAIGTSLGVILFSFLFFGFWLPDWLAKVIATVISNGREFVEVSSDIGLYPYGLIFLMIALLFARREIPTLVASSLLSVPYAGYYSIITALAFPLPWFIYCVTWLPAVMPTQFGMLVAPVGIIIVGIYQSYTKRQQLQSKTA